MQLMFKNSLWHASTRQDVAMLASSDDSSVMRTVPLLPISFSFALSLSPCVPSLLCLPSVAAGGRASLWLHPVWLHQRYPRRTDRQTGVSRCRQTVRGWESKRIRKVRVNGWWREVKKEAMARQMRPALGESVLTNRGGAGFQVWLCFWTERTSKQLTTLDHWSLLTNYH